MGTLANGARDVATQEVAQSDPKRSLIWGWLAHLIGSFHEFCQNSKKLVVGLAEFDKGILERDGATLLLCQTVDLGSHRFHCWEQNVLDDRCDRRCLVAVTLSNFVLD